MDDKELNAILLENRRMREALEFISDWVLPELKDKEGRVVSYAYMRGSNGERDYMRAVSQQALKGE